VDISKVLADVAMAPVRVGLLAADTGLAVGALALGVVKESLGEEGPRTVEGQTVDPLTEILPLRGAIIGANRVAGLIDRVSVEGSSLERILAPGGLVDRLLDEDGPLERMFAEDGVIERVFAEDGIVDKLTVKDGPLEQLAETAEILSRLQPAVEALTPTADTLESAVDTLNRMVNSLSAITDRIPRRRAARSAVRAKPDVDDDSVNE
jgi:hypothetical protein